MIQPIELLSSSVDPDHKTVCLYSTGNAVSNQRQGNLSAIKTAHTEDGILFTVTFEKYSDGTVYLSGAEVLPTRPPAIPNIPNQRGRLYCRPQTVYSQYMTP